MDVVVKACLTSWGWVGTAASSVGLLGTALPMASRGEALAILLLRWPHAQEALSPLLASLHQTLSRYFEGERVDLTDVALDVRRATEFQLRVWDVVRSIPRGRVRSYKWVAVQAGSSLASRAVGRVMATNPFPIVVPCNRVVGQDGSLTGFGGGLEMKRRLLRMEGVTLPVPPFLTTAA